MPVGNRPSRKWWYIGAGGVLLVVGTAAGFATLSGASPIADPSKMASVERGTTGCRVLAALGWRNYGRPPDGIHVRGL